MIDVPIWHLTLERSETNALSDRLTETLRPLKLRPRIRQSELPPAPLNNHLAVYLGPSLPLRLSDILDVFDETMPQALIALLNDPLGRTCKRIQGMLPLSAKPETHFKCLKRALERRGVALQSLHNALTEEVSQRALERFAREKFGDMPLQDPLRMPEPAKAKGFVNAPRAAAAIH